MSHFLHKILHGQNLIFFQPDFCLAEGMIVKMKNSEYAHLLKPILEKIKENNKDIEDKVDSLNCAKPFKNLIILFLSKLKEEGVNTDLYDTVEQMIIEKNNIERMKNEHKCYLGISGKDRELYTFNNILCECNQKKGKEFYENALKYVINQCENNNGNGNIIDYFLRYVVANNYDEIKYGTWDDANWCYGYYESTIYGYPLGSITLETIELEDGKESFSPESLYIRKNLQGLRLGAFLFRKLMQDMSEKHPGEKLVSTTVLMSNVNVIKLLTRLGATIWVDGEMVDDPIYGMNHTSEESCMVEFSPETIRSNAQLIIDRPTEQINKIVNFAEERKDSRAAR